MLAESTRAGEQRCMSLVPVVGVVTRHAPTGFGTSRVSVRQPGPARWPFHWTSYRDFDRCRASLRRMEKLGIWTTSS